VPEDLGGEFVLGFEVEIEASQLEVRSGRDLPKTGGRITSEFAGGGVDDPPAGPRRFRLDLDGRSTSVRR
jgi:hypothetical protein